jgi:hypothetical protein
MPCCTVYCFFLKKKGVQVAMQDWQVDQAGMCIRQIVYPSDQLDYWRIGQSSGDAPPFLRTCRCCLHCAQGARCSALENSAEAAETHPDGRRQAAANHPGPRPAPHGAQPASHQPIPRRVPRSRARARRDDGTADEPRRGSRAVSHHAHHSTCAVRSRTPVWI